MNTAKKNQSTTHKPEWLRLAQATAIFGVGRSKLYELIKDGKVKSTSLRTRGQVKGTRLISYDSLSDYIEKSASQ
ncbi:helix-turn-helix domain-containing protein [Verrucomicrobiaceae bacterium N1E253]|uniref:Helix-turn-helix domain-containing protein n=1 Tax=Oceaniferula marina TaxID=2748318 RepID=A0A851GFG9_9BACT|nr:helix-turn-helix domain-containing protein [Oceaniferula marina]